MTNPTHKARRRANPTSRRREPSDTQATIPTSSTAHSHSTTSETPRPTSPASSNDHASTSNHTNGKTYSPTSSKKHGNSAPPTNQDHDHSAPTSQTDYHSASSTGNDKPTAAPNGNSKTAHTNANGHSSSHSTTPIAWEQLSPRHTGILLHIEMPVTWYGYSEKEVATKLGVTTNTVRRCRTELHNAILETQR